MADKEDKELQVPSPPETERAPNEPLAAERTAGVGAASGVGAAAGAGTAVARSYVLRAESGHVVISGSPVSMRVEATAEPVAGTAVELTGTITAQGGRAGVEVPDSATFEVQQGAIDPSQTTARLEDMTLEAFGTVSDTPRSDTSDATVTHAPPPPDIPELRSAAISPEWMGGRLTIVSTPAESALPIESLMAALAAARMQLERVLGELAAAPGNVDRRLLAFVARVAANVPTSPPNQVTVFAFGQEADALRLRIDHAVREGELSADQAAELQSAAYQLSDCALQFPAWRDFKRNARSASLTREQMAEAPRLAVALADQLETPQAREYVDESVPQALRELATSDLAPTPDDPSGVLKAGADQLALDIVESIENILKRLSSAAVQVWNDFVGEAGEGARTQVRRAGRLFGGGVVVLTFTLMTSGALAALVYFAPSYPWLADVVAFLKYAAPFFGGR